MIFRNIRISDPRPGRYLFGFHPTADIPAQYETWAGIRFENIDYRAPLETSANTLDFRKIRRRFMYGS